MAYSLKLWQRVNFNFWADSTSVHLFELSSLSVEEVWRKGLQLCLDSVHPKTNIMD